VKFTSQTVSNDPKALPAQNGEWVLNVGENLLDFNLTVTSNRDETVHVDGAVVDFYGDELPDSKLSADIPVKAGKPSAKAHSAKPQARHVGPFYFKGTWKSANGEAKGTFAIELGIPNSVARVEDFEELKYKQAGGPLENSPAAQHHGQNGLI